MGALGRGGAKGGPRPAARLVVAPGRGAAVGRRRMRHALGRGAVGAAAARGLAPAAQRAEGSELGARERLLGEGGEAARRERVQLVVARVGAAERPAHLVGRSGGDRGGGHGAISGR